MSSSIRWGIMGTGTIAHLFVEALLTMPSTKVHAVAAQAEDRAKKFAAEHGIAVALNNYDKLLEQADVDVVYIATTNEQHHQSCIACLNAGKAVLCEKPFALNTVQAREVIELARMKGLFCMEAMWMRFAPAVREALLLVKDGRVGDVQFFSGQLGFPYVADAQNRLFRQPGGGSLFDLGVYPLSMAHALLGKPIKVISSAKVNATGVDEQFAAVLTYRDGAQGIIASSLKAKLSNSASIHGRDAVLNLNEPIYFPEGYQLVSTPPHRTGQRASGKLSKLRRYPVFRTLADVRSRRLMTNVSKRTSQSGYCFEAAEVQRCLQAGLMESPEMPWKDTLEVMEVMDLIRSQWEKKEA